MQPPATSHQPPAIRPRRGFTLTELLVVIAIIAMLVAITSVAVVRALGTAKQTRMKTEVDQLDAAFKAYKEKYGSYPPCDWLVSSKRVPQHIARAFPRYDMGTAPGYAKLYADLTATGADRLHFRPDQALVFWLSGFSNDPQHPFVSFEGYQIVDGVIKADASGNPVVVKRTPFFEFDPTRLKNVAEDMSGTITEEIFVPVPKSSGGTIDIRPMPSYFPQGVTPGLSGAPHVYWDADSYNIGSMFPPVPNRNGFNSGLSGGKVYYQSAGAAVPYWHDINGNSTADMPPTEDWVNPDSFQIIASGTDGKFGQLMPSSPIPYRAYPTGFGYDTSTALADEDNVTNFCGSARLGDARP